MQQKPKSRREIFRRIEKEIRRQLAGHREHPGTYDDVATRGGGGEPLGENIEKPEETPSAERESFKEEGEGDFDLARARRARSRKRRMTS